MNYSNHIIMLLFVIALFIPACSSNNQTEEVKQFLLGDWVEVINNDKNAPDSLRFIDKSTFAMRKNDMECSKAFKYDIDENYLILFYQNSQMDWVEASRHAYKLNENQLIINNFNNDPASRVVFKKVHN